MEAHFYTLFDVLLRALHVGLDVSDPKCFWRRVLLVVGFAHEGPFALFLQQRRYLLMSHNRPVWLVRWCLAMHSSLSRQHTISGQLTRACSASPVWNRPSLLCLVWRIEALQQRRQRRLRGFACVPCLRCCCRHSACRPSYFSLSSVLSLSFCQDSLYEHLVT